MKRTTIFLALMLAMALPSWAQNSLADYEVTTGENTSMWRTLSDNATVYTQSGRWASSVLPIGFTFRFVETDYTQFSFNTDCNLRLGPNATTTDNSYQPFAVFTSAGKNAPKINAMGRAGSLTEGCYIKYEVQGTAPDRVLVCEYKINNSNDITLHQVQLFESTNEIRFVYGQRPTSITNSYLARFQAGMSTNSTNLWTLNLTTNTAVYSQAIDNEADQVPLEGRYFTFTPHPRYVTELHATNITASSADLAWSPCGEETQWQVLLSDTPVNDPSSSANITTVGTPQASFTGLQPNTVYNCYVRTSPSEGDPGPWRHARFHTPVVSFPYHCDFANTDENNRWEMLNSDLLSNSWRISTVTGLSDNALYVTQGSPYYYYKYIDNFRQTIYATRNLQLDANTTYHIAFDWKCNGSADTAFLRLFLVPNNVWLQASTDISTVSATSAPEGWIAVTSSQLCGATGWQHFDTTIAHSADQAETFQLVAVWRQDNNRGYQPPAAIDNLHVTTCLPVTDLAVSGIDTTSAHLSWNSSGTQWQTLLSTEPVDGFTSQELTPVDATALDMDNLEPGHTYYFYVRTYADADDQSEWRSLTFSTGYSLPYSTDFSDPDDRASWQLINGNQVNQWTFGTAAHADDPNPDPGNQALYISNNGTDYAYNLDPTVYIFSYAARLLYFEGGEYTVSFDWRCNGEHFRDLLRAFLVPERIMPEAGNSYGMDYGTNDTPEGWIDLANGKLNLQDTWQRHSRTLTVPEGTYRLVFFWKNDAWDGNQHPAAVDNIVVSRPTLTLADATVYDSTASHEHYNVAYTRTYQPGTWVPLFVPFTSVVEDWRQSDESSNDFTFAELDRVTTETINGELADVLHWRELETTDTLHAGRPYLLKYSGTTTTPLVRNFTGCHIAAATDTTIVSRDNGETGDNARLYTLTGTYTQMDGAALTALHAYCMGSGNFWPAATDNALRPQRFYLTITDPVSHQPKSAPQGGTILRVGEDNVGIIDVRPEPQRPYDPAYYDLLGRRVAQPRKGHIYIHNHQKIIY